MSRSPLVLVAVLLVASVGAGLVGADVTGTATAGYGDSTPRKVAGSGPLGPPVAGDVGTDADVPAIDPASPSGNDGAVRVGVIGSAFTDSATLDGRVAERYRTTAPRFGLVAGDHDTAVASVVAERARDSSLYLASVGYEPTPDEYARAVEWLVAQDVDVIVDAGSYFPRTADGRERIADAAERAATSGTVFVTSGGNTAQRHWRGTVADGGWVAFDDDGTQGNRLGNGTIAGSVTLRLYWEDAADYDLYLYRDTPGEDTLVAKSTRESGHAEAIDATLPRGNYYVAVYARDPGTGPVDLYAARNRLAFAGANGSAIAPTAAPGVISVGAVGSNGRLAAYSPADTDVRADGAVRLEDGTLLRGTSAAAPRVASVVVAMTAEAGSGTLTPAEVEQLLRTTAEDGRVDPAAAVAAAADHRDRLDDGATVRRADEGTDQTGTTRTTAENATVDGNTTGDGNWAGRGP